MASGNDWCSKLVPWNTQGYDMYRIYVLRQRRGGSDVLHKTRTQTPSRAAALAVWSELRAADYDDSHILLISRDGKRLASHRYATSPDHPEHFPVDQEPLDEAG
ncbi:MAG: hypothetical protein WC284_19055 [Candidimonas sp.]